MIDKLFFESFAIDTQDVTPKYRQLANSIRHFIQLNKLPSGLRLPSINELTNELEVSRDTGAKAYQELKRSGIVGSVHGKGHFISKKERHAALKICILFKDEAEKKEIMEDSVISALPENTVFDFYCVRNSKDLLQRISAGIPESFTHYIFIPGISQTDTMVAE